MLPRISRSEETWPGQFGQIFLGMIDDRDALVQALQPLYGLPGDFVHRMADAARHRIEPIRHHPGEFRLPAAKTFAERLQPAGGLGLGAGKLGDALRQKFRLPHLVARIHRTHVRRASRDGGDRHEQRHHRDGEA